MIELGTRGEQELEQPKVTSMVFFEGDRLIGGNGWQEELSERTPEDLARQAPRDVFALTTYKLAEVKAVIDGETVNLTSKPFGHRKFYIDAQVWSIEELEAKNPLFKLAVPIASLKNSGAQRVVELRHGGWRPFFDGDTIIHSRDR